MSSRMIGFITFPVMKARLTGQYFLITSFLDCQKMRLTLTFLQYLGTSPVLHDSSKMMENGLATTSASSLCTCGVSCQVLSLPNQSLNQLYYHGKSFFFQPSSLILEGLGSLKTDLSYRD